VCGIVGGIRRTVDGGKNWELINPLMGFYTDESLTGIHFADHRVGWCVGTTGTIIKIIEDGPTAINGDDKVPQKKNVPFAFSVSSVQGYGARRYFDVQYTLSKPDTVSIFLYSIKGAIVSTIFKRCAVSPGKHTIRFAVSRLASGVYICKFNRSSGTVSKMVEVVH
jgi:hypothetical protein